MARRATRAAPLPDLSDGVAFVEGRYGPVGKARISILDWGFLRSDATYDVAHVWKGRFFRLDLHLDRFVRSMARLHLEIPYGRAEIADVMHECVRRAGLRDAYVEVIATRGRPLPGSRDPRTARNQFLAFAIPFVWIATPEQRSAGLHMAVASVRRIPPDSVDPTVKNYHWLDLQAGLFEAYERGAETVVLADAAGNLCEGPGFNVFVVRAGTVITPDRGVLEGITRRTAMDLCAELGVPVDAALLPVAVLHDAEEVFVTSTAGGIMPVTRIDGEPVGDGQPGPVTRRLADLYWAKHEDPAWSTAVDYG